MAARTPSHIFVHDADFLEPPGVPDTRACLRNCLKIDLTYRGSWCIKYCSMYKTDARKLKHGELTELRKRAVTAVQKGESPESVAGMFGVTRAAVYGWLARYRDGGWDALDARKRGGRPPKLNAGQIEWIRQVVTSGDPRQYASPLALWTCKSLQAVIDNLLSNAIKYSPDGTQVSISLRRENQQLILDVLDQGWGVREADRQHLFEPFYQGTSPSTGPVRGTGLGLAICREIVLAHHGYIWADSRLGEGSTFYVLLPLDRVKAEGPA